MNLIHIAGHLGDDPEERFTPGGQKVINFRVAVKSRRRGEESTTWYRVTIWGDRFDKMLPHLKKGSAVIVVGELQKPEVYTDREGKPQVSLEITAEVIRFSPFGRSGGGTSNSSNQSASSPTYVQPSQMANRMGLEDDLVGAGTFDDNLPF